MFVHCFKRNKSTTLVTTLVLVLSYIFCSFGFSSFYSVQSQLSLIEQQYSTIAVLTVGYPDLSGDFEELSDGSILYSDGTLWHSSERVASVAEKAPQVIGWDRRILYSTSAARNQGLSSGAIDPLGYCVGYDRYCYNLSVVAVRCLQIEPTDYSSDGVPTYYNVEFELLDAIARNPVYELESERTDIWIEVCNLMTKEGNIPFEPGKTYLLRGFYEDYKVQQQARLAGEGRTDLEFYWERSMSESWRDNPSVVPKRRMIAFFPFTMDHMGSDWIESDIDLYGKVRTLHPQFYKQRYGAEREYFITPETAWPFYAEYSGTWQEFLNTEEGRIWTEEIIPACKENWSAAPLILTNNVQYLHAFATGDASLLDGRYISAEEYSNGEPVCMVSGAYAELNDLEVGDKISLELYVPNYINEWVVVGTYPMDTYADYTSMLPLVEENKLNLQLEYTIVGLYTSPNQPIDPGGNNFRPDTIFAPKASVPGSEQYEDTATPVLNTLILENGSIEEFEAYMNEQGVEGKFQYFDYGYSEMKASLEAMAVNAERMALLGAAVFCLGLALFLVLNLRRMAPTVRGMRLIGVKAGSAARQMLTALAAMSVAAAVLGTGLSWLLYDMVCKAVLSQSVELDPRSLLLCGAAELTVTLVLCAIGAISGSRTNLMGSKRGGK